MIAGPPRKDRRHQARPPQDSPDKGDAHKDQMQEQPGHNRRIVRRLVEIEEIQEELAVDVDERVADEWVTQLLRQGDAKVFKKYSQMKLQMKREALQKLNRQANESGRSFDTERPN